MRYYIIAGEASGDLHGANLIAALQKKDSAAVFRFWGGDSMSIYAGEPVTHIRKMAFMGFAEVMMNIRTIFSFFRKAKKDIIAFQPDVLILIDYPGFNLRMAEWAKRRGMKVVYYIVPQVWAWHKSRVWKLKKYTDLLIPVLPFEEQFLKNYNCRVKYLGHPLLDETEPFLEKAGKREKDNKLLALLPGSRKQEIKAMLPVFLKAARELNIPFVIAAAPSIPDLFYTEIIKLHGFSSESNILSRSGTYKVLQNATFAFVTSGTATLETALLGVPQIVCYKANKISYYIARMLVDLKYISLVNLIMDKGIVTELIQSDFNVRNLTSVYHRLHNEMAALEMKSGYDELRLKLGGKGASERVAEAILELLS